MSNQEQINEEYQSSLKPNATLRKVGNSAISFAYKHSPEKIKTRAEDRVLRRIMTTKGYDIKLAAEGLEVEKALELEQQIWDEEGYGNLDVYAKYIPQSRIFATYDGDRCIGMNRLFAGSPEPPPFITEMDYYDENLRQKLLADGSKLKIEEFGTVGVVKELRLSRVFLDLCRYAFRDASERGIEEWGIIMEPERVEKMNKSLGFTFNQVGPTQYYQGGDCAPHIMNFQEVHANMSNLKPELYNSFINEPL